ncbi:GntR family transcriptional regulator [Sporosarcina siberiensis]|uniref:GntR family transcriptional regulator n=1 Tax=Sporosarcina siberiensis TaxID=1365606 RepID=A0ABW4SDG9_9BACL
MEKVKASASLAEQAYSLLKTAIMSGKLASEIELPEERLAADLGVSRTPLREAIRRLAAEGLVVLNKGKPATVATFTKEDSLDFMELRSVLEIYNIGKVVFVEDPVFIHELEENLDRQMDAIKEDDYQEFIDYDREFHLILASENENSKIREMIHQVNSGVNRAFIMLSNTVHMSAKGAYEEHQRIVEAIKLKDVDLATKEMTIHLKNIEERFLYYYKSKETE